MDTPLFYENVQEMYETAPCGYLSMLADGKIIRVNQTFLDWTGYSREEIVSGKRFQDLLPTPARIFYETQLAPLLQMQGRVKEVAVDLLCKERNPLPVLWNCTKQEGPQGTPAFIHSAFFDATDRRRYESDLLLARRELEGEVEKRTAELKAEILERKRVEDDLRELTSKLLSLRDDERRKLARELHDSVGQLLSGLNMNLALIQSTPLTPEAAIAVTENVGWVTEISSEIRTISHLLHPPLLDEVGLTSALTWYVDGLAQRAGMKINLEISSDLGRLPAEQELAIFRVVQECLTNVHRHSGSKTAAVRVLSLPDNVRVEVQDQGTGIAAEQLTELKASRSGVGLRGMRERARQFGGTLDISSKSRGTLITTTFPRLKPTD
ncbi:MAG TPA: ATP-binding protein [Terriglobales bacterium]